MYRFVSVQGIFKTEEINEQVFILTQRGLIKTFLNYINTKFFTCFGQSVYSHLLNDVHSLLT